MDFEEQEDHDRDEEMEMVAAAAYHSLGGGGGGGGGGTVTPHNKLPMPPSPLPPPLSEVGPTPLSSISNNSNNHRGVGGVRYRECLKNHAVGLGGHAVDGCGEFLPAGPEGSLDAIKCAACSCHRNFHRREIEGAAVPFLPPPPHHLFQFHPLPPPPPYYRSPAGYLHVRPTLALPSTSDDQEDASDPMMGMAVAAGGRKRFRTKFTAEQKEKMMSLAERLGWRIQKQDEGLVQDFCSDTGLRRHVLKVWMHNNKHTLGKKP